MSTKSCCIIGCKNQNIGADSGVIFYKFPEDKNLKKKWIEACRKNEALSDKKWEPETGDVICNVHFVSGQKSPHDWHPDYIPSVFRSLRRNIKKRGRFVEDENDAVPKPRKRLSLSTPSKPAKAKIPVPATTGGVKKPLRLSKKKGKLQALTPEEIEFNLDSPLKSPKRANLLNEDDSDDMSDSGKHNKKSSVENDSSEESGTPLRNLSVVLERTSDKKIKLTTGDVTIKEEPIGDLDYISPTKISPKKLIKSRGRPPKSAQKTGPKTQCKKCPHLEQKLLVMERNLISGSGSDRCQRCPVIEHELKKVEEELEDIIESKLTKCQRCSLVEQKCKRVENNLRKAQTELNKLQNKLSSIEICEDAFVKYKSKVKLYTGFPNYESLSLVFEHLKPHFPGELAKGMTHFQMFILVMMRLKMNLPFWDLTYRFGASPNNIQQFFPQYITVMESMLSHVVLWPKANMKFRLEVLAGNLKQNFMVIQDPVSVDTLMLPSSDKLNDKEKMVRVCAALYHITQLVSSNHSQQLLKILKSKDDTEKKTTPESNKTSEEKTMEVIEKVIQLSSSEREKSMVNGTTDIDDSDIFFEDFTKDSGLNPNEALEMECKHLSKELESLNQKLTTQFKFYTGLRNFEVFNNLLGFLQAHVSHISTEKLNYFQQLHLILIRFKLNLEVQDLAYMFNMDTDHVVYLTREWMDVMVQKLSRYIDWPSGIEDSEGERRLLGSVKLKYQILWNPHQAPRNRDTGRDREKIDLRKLLRVCAAVYNIDDIEVFRDGKKESKAANILNNKDEKDNKELENECRKLRTQIYDLKKHVMSSVITCFSEKTLQNNDQMVRYYTGFPSYEIMKNVFELIIPDKSRDNRKALSPLMQFLAVLVRLKLNLSSHDLAFRFGMGHSNIYKLSQDWMMLLHLQLSHYITWPDDDDDVEFFTDMLCKTYAYLRNGVTHKRNDRKSDTGFFDIATLVCAGLYNVGEVSFNVLSESDFESFDEDW